MILTTSMKEGMHVHSFDRFYVLTKFMLPSLRDLKFSDQIMIILVHIKTIKMLKTQKHEIYVRFKNLL